jgi:hypothetical protein
MNAERFRQYGRVLILLDGLGDDAVSARGSRRLRELAQDILLSRDVPFDEVDGLSDEAALVLAHLTTAGALDREAASEIWRAIRSCGPSAGMGLEDIELPDPAPS